MTFVIGTYGDYTANGWSRFTNPSVRYYTSTTDGHDSNNGLSSVPNPTNSGGPGAPGPKRTIFSTMNALRLNGWSGTNWHCLLRRNDTFANQCFSEAMFDGIIINGASNSDPAVFAAYDPSLPNEVDPASVAGARPLIYTFPDSYLVFFSTGSFGGFRIAFVGIDATSPNDTGRSAFEMRDDSPGILFFENCHIRGWSNGFDCIGGNDPPVNGPIYFRRCIIERNLANGLHSSPKNSPYVMEECIFYKNGWGNYPPNNFSFNAPNLFFHQMYIDMTQVGGDDSQDHLNSTITQFRGNYGISSATDLQMRGGSPATYDNCLIREASCFTHGNPYGGSQQNLIFNNVSILSRGLPGGNTPEFFEGLKPYYYAMNWNYPSTHIARNIICNSIEPAMSFGINVNQGQNGYNVYDNIFYHYGPDTLTNGVSSDGSLSPPKAILHYTGSIFDVAITNGGTGYVPKFCTITGIRGTRQDPLDDIVLQVDTTAGIFSNAGPIWIEGLNGGGNIPSLNSMVVNCKVLSSTELQILNTDGINSLSWTSGGTQRVYIPYYGCPAYTNLSSSGSGASAMPIVGGSTAVVALTHSADDAGGQAFIGNGINYAVGDTMTINNSGLGGTGSGLVVTVTQLCQNTIGPNKFDCAGTNATYNWPDPNRTPSSYLATLGRVGPNCSFTGSITNGVLTVSGMNTPSLCIGDCIVWPGQTRADYVFRAGNGEFALAEVLTWEADTQTVSSRAMSTDTATFTGSITAGILTISGISGNVYPNMEQAQQVTWSGTNSAGEARGAVRTMVVTNGGTGGTPGTYPGISLTTSTSAQYRTNGSLAQGDAVSGTGLVATVVVGAGGNVTSVTIASAADGGAGYQIHDPGFSSGAAGLPSGWTCRVQTIAPRVFIRYGGNNTYTLASANNTSNKSNASSQTMQSWSTQQFVEELLLQSKNNYDVRLTSKDGLLPYIQAGFGIEDGSSPGPVLLGQACL